MIAEVPETEAAGALALCYADIRRRLGVPVVNLIWRHLAALGEIEACWERVRDDLPIIEARAAGLNGAARRMAGEWSAPSPLPWPEPASDILVSYERGNSLNLATVRQLLGCALVEGEGSLPQAPARLPPVPPFASLVPASKVAVETLAAAGPGADTGIRPTLWVHLACAPALLAAAALSLPPLLAHEQFRAAHARLTALSPRPAGDGLSNAAVEALARFNRRIGEMLLIGLHLDRSRLHTLENRP